MTIDWQPTSSIAALQERANVVNQIRRFFSSRDILEVETPLLCHATVTAAHIHSISAGKNFFLQTSPEYAMKRLLAAGSGPIFQMCKAFREGDSGKIHNPEFTILEWYRPGFTHHDLMDEMDELLQQVLKTSKAERLTYAAAFEKFLNLNPHTAEIDELALAAERHIDLAMTPTDRNDWLDLLLTHCIEPKIGKNEPIFLYDFPTTQSALAKIRYDENPPVASRFEVYFKGFELANGFHELQDADEQRQRFQNDLDYRIQNHLPTVPIDERFLSALQAGLPDCSGVAVGVDRLVMLALGAKNIKDAVSFIFENA